MQTKTPYLLCYSAIRYHIISNSAYSISNMVYKVFYLLNKISYKVSYLLNKVSYKYLLWKILIQISDIVKKEYLVQISDIVKKRS